MRQPRSALSWRDVRHGLLLLGLLATGVLTVFFVDLVLREIREGPRIVVLADASRELQPGDRVWVAGRPVGRVLSVRLLDPEAGHNVLVEGVLVRGVGNVIRDDATVVIKGSALLGPPVVAILPGSPDRPPFDLSDTLRTTPTVVDAKRLLAMADTLRELIDASAPEARLLARLLASEGGTLGSLRQNPELMSGLRAEADRLRWLLGPDGPGTAAALLHDTTLGARARSLAERAERIASAVDSAGWAGEGGAAAREALAALPARLRALEARLEKGHGTLGRALHDEAAARAAARLRTTLYELTAALLADPFLWLRFRVF